MKGDLVERGACLANQDNLDLREREDKEDQQDSRENLVSQGHWDQLELLENVGSKASVESLDWLAHQELMDLKGKLEREALMDKEANQVNQEKLGSLDKLDPQERGESVVNRVNEVMDLTFCSSI